MITVKQYAEERGITIQAVHQSMTGKRKKERLEGHVHVIDGAKWLDEEAVAVLDEHRAKNPVVIIQQDKDETIERLKEENEALLRKIAAQADRIAELADWKAEKAIEIANAEQARKALAASEDAQKALEAQIGVLTAVSESERERTAQAEKTAQEASGRAQKAESELAAYKALPWYKKLRRD